MKVVIQRVKKVQAVTDEGLVGDIRQGLLPLVGVGPDDEQEDFDYAVRKITNMWISSDDTGKMNLPVQDVKGSILSVSQSTLFADTKKGDRSAFTGAAKPDKAEQLYNAFNEVLAQCVPVGTGVFGADMHVSFVNDGPVTIILDTKARQSLDQSKDLLYLTNIKLVLISQ